MDVSIREGSDAEYASQLTQSNMGEYYKDRKYVWDPYLFEESWKAFSNCDVLLENSRVGIIRFSYDESSTYIRDLQIEPPHQRKGIGRKCLDLAVNHAAIRRSKFLKLRVFPENPAVELYERYGFKTISNNGAIIEMELNLDAIT